MNDVHSIATTPEPDAAGQRTPADPGTERGGVPGAGPRHTLLIRTAKLIGRRGEALCIVRDAWADGIRIRTFTPLPPEPELELELPNGQRHRIVRVRERGELVEFRFLEPIDIERLVAHNPVHLRKREIHLNCLVPAVLSAGAGECDVRLHEISQHGARIECGLRLGIGERVRIGSDALPPVMATVEWRRAPFYRVLFDRVFPFDELARLCGVMAPAPLG